MILKIIMALRVIKKRGIERLDRSAINLFKYEINTVMVETSKKDWRKIIG